MSKLSANTNLKMSILVLITMLLKKIISSGDIVLQHKELYVSLPRTWPKRAKVINRNDIETYIQTILTLNPIQIGGNFSAYLFFVIFVLLA